MKRIFSVLILLALIFSVMISACSCLIRDTAPLRIGVLLPLTGPDAVASDEVLDWAAANVNENGGIKNRKIELVYKDTNERDISELAQEFIDDRSIKIVIGPSSSTELYEIASAFIENEKILISPTSTAGDIFRAFGGERFIWRTCQSDVAQVRTILYIIASRDAEKISFIYEDSIYGKTFSDWIGFFSIELGIELLNMVKFECGQEDFSWVVNKALEDDPDYIVCAAFPDDAVRIKKELDQAENSAQLFLTDAAQAPHLIKGLGEAAEGLEGITPAPDPTAGFDVAYRLRFGHGPPPFAATTYDAFILSLCALARQEYTPREGIQESFEKVVTGRGTRVGWDKVAINDAVKQILQGELPDIDGASGTLEFDEKFGVDPIETFYSHWRVEKQDFSLVEVIGSGQSSRIGVVKEGASAYRTLASEKFAELEEKGEISYIPKDKRDLWAVIIATDSGWENYRHQADALAIYNWLRSNGVQDNRIILFLIDDISSSERNPTKGNVHHKVDGKNLREGVVIDYSGSEANIQNFSNVLLGKVSDKARDVLRTDESCNIFIYVVGHGGDGFISFEYGGKFEERQLLEIIEDMYRNGKYRQIFMISETCHGESMALNLETPGVLYFTGASRNEPAFACNYDREIDAWLADDFTYQVLGAISKDPDLSLLELYTNVSERVAGSHVMLMNYSGFGNIAVTSVCEFNSP